MNTKERAAALAKASESFPILGEVTAEGLLEVVRMELGHAEILDGFRPYGDHFSRARALSPIVHVVSGNTPHAALQSVTRGLLLGARNRVKVPSAGLPEVGAFLAELPAGLQALVEVSPTLPEGWLEEAEAVIVYGSDETIGRFRKLVGTRVRYEEHPHRVSVGLVYEDPHYESVVAAAADVSAFGQKGCLSPHDIYVAGDARTYAVRLAEEMAKYEAANPRGAVTSYEASEIMNVRANYRFRSASDMRVQLWESEGSTAWTVIYEDDPWFAGSCLNRVVYVKPLPLDLAESLGPAKAWLAATGIWPAEPRYAERAAELGPSRICALGRMQLPPVGWHQEGKQILAGLARWVDFEPEIC
ncbi:hypothetical protein BH09VER1_BH09VER1_30510 [soil metagenome]